MHFLTLLLAVVSLTVTHTGALAAAMTAHVSATPARIQATAKVVRPLVVRFRSRKKTEVEPELHPVFTEVRDYQQLKVPTFLRRNKVIAS